ncbi:accessory Sec system protein Asp5 [Streptococcus sp. DD13]|uniref:accessory Sec system protein Asp5 n=1 Tax=Streptococcus sp. DD13 TaxID=1777881 RepID=UPI000793B647|nr:hypothetical protein [Streptococcus sp. DD13]KXT77742.1 hypothetical protein STRDD13_01422 [Streptococcus sp. DD13]
MRLEYLFFVLEAVLSVVFIFLMTIQPRQQQTFSEDVTSQIGRPSYWRSKRGLKITTVLVAASFLLVLLCHMLLFP